MNFVLVLVLLIIYLSIDLLYDFGITGVCVSYSDYVYCMCVCYDLSSKFSLYIWEICEINYRKNNFKYNRESFCSLIFRTMPWFVLSSAISIYFITSLAKFQKFPFTILISSFIFFLFIYFFWLFFLSMNQRPQSMEVNFLLWNLRGKIIKM